MEEILKAIAPALGIIFYSFLFQKLGWYKDDNPAVNYYKREQFFSFGRKCGRACRNLLFH